jgi:hypothetical protein
MHTLGRLKIKRKKYMPLIAGICIFITIMTTLSIPIIAVIKWKPKNNSILKKLDSIEKRLENLENENAIKTLEMSSLKNEVSFTSKLLDSNK